MASEGKPKGDRSRGTTPTPARASSGTSSALAAGANVDAYIAGDRRRALAAKVEIPDRVAGAVLFADISGFTPLTEALARELGASRGPEELSRILEMVFDAVLAHLNRFDGSVIYFSGDAVTCWIDGDDGRIAIACGLAMQHAMEEVGTITTPAGTMIQLGMKVAVVAGPARRFVVGTPDIQLIDVLAGSPLDRVAELEHHAVNGEVLVDGSTLDAIRAEIDLTAVSKEGGFGVVSAIDVPDPVRSPPSPPRLPRSIVRQWLLPVVYERLNSGRGEFMAELRSAIPIFVRFGGIDYDRDDDAPRQLDDFITQVQRIVDAYGGNVMQLTIGDKGAYLTAVFGAPVAHEDDAVRACTVACELVDLEAVTAVTGLQLGLTRGALFSGTYGHRYRRAFTCLGDSVNLSARLMSAAPKGQIYVGAELSTEVKGKFEFEHLEPITVKGKTAPVRVDRLIGAKQAAKTRRPRAGPRLIGRAQELSELLQVADRARAGRLQVAAVVAEAGLGKSTLVESALRRMAEEGMRVYQGATAAFGSGSYLVWRDIWAQLFDLRSPGDMVAELEHALTTVDPDLVPRLPLLSSLFGVPIEDNTLTRSFDAKLRKSSLETLLLSYLTLRAEHEPMVLWLDDCHWIDPLSQDLLKVVTRGSLDLPVLVVLTYRPGSFSPNKSSHTLVLELDRLETAACEELLTDRLAELYGAGAAGSPRLLQRLVERSEGNPFYLGELANFLHTKGVDLTDESAGSIELPVSLANLVLSRIDALAEPPRRTLKVASVVGREFGTDQLAGAYPLIGARKQVAGHLRRLCAEDLVVRETPAEDIHAFKHSVIREVTYGSLPFALDAAARADGRLGWSRATPTPSTFSPTTSGIAPTTTRTRVSGPGWSGAQARFANAAAVDYFRRVTPLLGDAERLEILMQLGAVLGLTGEWTESEAVFGEAIGLAESLGDTAGAARARTERADATRKQGRFDEAEAELGTAEREFDAVADSAGTGRVLHLQGTISAQQGDYVDARRHYERSLAIRASLGDRQAEASLLSNLAILAEYEEDYERSVALNEEALALRTELGDRWGIGVSRNNLGMVMHLQGNNDRGANGVPLNPAFKQPFTPAYADTNAFVLPNPFKIGALPQSNITL